MSPDRESVVDINFVDPGPLVDGDLELRLVETIPADQTRGFEPTYSFAMVDSVSGGRMGGIRLRVGHSEHLTLYRGHVGFGVDERYRGCRLALRSCRLLAALARHHSIVPIWLTCDEGNLASQRTMELLGAEFVGIRTMPADYPYAEYYAPESRIKRRYRWTPPMIGTAPEKAVTIRDARVSDAKAIATIHVRTWQAAYRDLVPASYLNELSIDKREEAWRKRLERGAATVCVAALGDEICGWISVGPSRDTDANPSTGELFALYVAPEHWRRGIGRQLWRHSLPRLREAEFTETTLWVLGDNRQARAFYRSAGFVEDPGVEKSVRLGDADVLEIRMRRRLGS